MSDKRKRLQDLLAQQATDRLETIDREELQELLNSEGAPSEYDFELAVAAAWRSVAAQHEVSNEAPGTLVAKLEADAERFFTPRDEAPVSVSPTSGNPSRASRRSFGWPLFFGAGWALTAAMLFVVYFDYRLAGPLDAAAERSALLNAASDAAVFAWDVSNVDGYGDVEGDVLWSGAQQRGFLRLSGMPVNDPTISQYQLWIVDPARDAEPVDGGVFDIARSGELVIPIDAKLKVASPTAFAITREQPGGVVVSEGPLLVVAPTS